MSVESTPANKQEIIDGVCRDRGLEIKDGCLDLSELSYEEVKSFLELLGSTGEFVFHGTCSSEVFNCLETRQGHCTVKESGNKMAVYASEDPTVAMVVSVLNKKDLQRRMSSYTTGYAISSESIRIRFSPEVYKLFSDGDTEMFADGYIYVLDRSKFINAADAHAEWHSESNVEPLLACRVSRNIATSIYTKENVLEIPEEELSRKKY